MSKRGRPPRGAQRSTKLVSAKVTVEEYDAYVKALGPVSLSDDIRAHVHDVIAARQQRRS